MLQKLVIVAFNLWVLALKKDVGVRVNEAGKDSHSCGKVNNCGSGGRAAALTDAGDLVTLHHDQHIVAGLAGEAVNQRGCTDGDDFFGRRRGCFLIALRDCGRRKCQVTQDNDNCEDKLQYASAHWHGTASFWMSLIEIRHGGRIRSE